MILILFDRKEYKKNSRTERVIFDDNILFFEFLTN